MMDNRFGDSQPKILWKLFKISKRNADLHRELGNEDTEEILKFAAAHELGFWRHVNNFQDTPIIFVKFK